MEYSLKYLKVVAIATSVAMLTGCANAIARVETVHEPAPHKIFVTTNGEVQSAITPEVKMMRCTVPMTELPDPHPAEKPTGLSVQYGWTKPVWSNTSVIEIPADFKRYDMRLYVGMEYHGLEGVPTRQEACSALSGSIDFSHKRFLNDQVKRYAFDCGNAPSGYESSVILYENEIKNGTVTGGRWPITVKC